MKNHFFAAVALMMCGVMQAAAANPAVAGNDSARRQNCADIARLVETNGATILSSLQEEHWPAKQTVALNTDARTAQSQRLAMLVEQAEAAWRMHMNNNCGAL